jgi:hypothetical protein
MRCVLYRQRALLDVMSSPTDLLTEHARRGKPVENGLVQVRLEVQLSDVWLIRAEKADQFGDPVTLFMGPPKLF